MSLNYTIRIFSPTGALLRILPQVHSARYRLAENEVGDFEITVPWKDNELPLLLSPPNNVEFYRNGVFAFGGIIRRQGARQESRIPFYTVSGPSYMQWLADARMHPSGVVTPGGVVVGTATTGTGDIEYTFTSLDNIMRFIVDAQVRDHNTQFYVGTGYGQSSVVDAYVATAYSTVLETLQAIATRAKDTTFDIIREDDGLLRFRTWSPSRGPDRSIGTSSPVVFDMRGGNLLNAEWSRDGNAVVNALWGGGPGDKAARYVWPDTEALNDAQSILDWGRIEGFIDAGNELTIGVQKKVQEELAKQAIAEESVSFQIAEFGRYSLGTDFDFGTKVTVVWSPILEFSDTIRGIEVRLDEGSGVAAVDINVGDTITGDSQTRASIYLGRYLRQLRKTISIQTRH